MSIQNEKETYFPFTNWIIAKTTKRKPPVVYECMYQLLYSYGLMKFKDCCATHTSYRSTTKFALDYTSYCVILPFRTTGTLCNIGNKVMSA